MAQWGLHEVSYFSSIMSTTDKYIGGVIFIAAGVFQWTPLKRTCLHRCRVPIGFFMTEWQDGASGALIMGIKHGAYCVGCCWALMAVLFVTGVMNLLWMVALAVFVLVEKVAPYGEQIGIASGVALAAAGVWMIVV
jgi:predicted metal-binding membrane protein